MTTVDEIKTEIATWLTDNGLLGPDDWAVLAGSLAVGLGNHSSDVDVYVVRACAGDLEGQQFFLGDRRIDCHDLSVVELRTAMTDLSTAADSGTEPPADLLALVNRVVDGIPLSNARVPEELRREGRAVVRTAVLAWSRVSLRRLWRRLLLASALHDIDDYRSCAVEFVEAAIYGALAHLGSTYPNPKWNWEKIAALPEPERVLGPITRLHRLLVDEPAPNGELIANLLGGLGVVVELPGHDTYPRRVDQLRVFQVGETTYLVLGEQAYVASPGAVELISHANGAMSIAALLDVLHRRYGASRERLDEDARHALRLLRIFGALEFTGEASPALASLMVNAVSEVFEPTLIAVGSVREILPRTYRVWLSWVEYLSHRDDLEGAFTAGQVGAAAAAVRGIARDLARVHLDRQGRWYEPGEELAFAQYYLGDEGLICRQLTDLFHTSARNLRPDDLEGRLEQVEAALVEDVALVLHGSLRTEDGHTALFVHLRELLDMAESLGVEFPVGAMMVQKSRRYGQPMAESETASTQAMKGR